MSVSNRFITWDLSTSDMTRDVNPNIEGIMQQLVLSPDNRWAAAFTNNNQVNFKEDLWISDLPFCKKETVDIQTFLDNLFIET